MKKKTDKPTGVSPFTPHPDQLDLVDWLAANVRQQIDKVAFRITLAPARPGPIPRQRDCLTCRREFLSAGAHNVICGDCKNGEIRMQARMVRYRNLRSLLDACS